MEDDKEIVDAMEFTKNEKQDPSVNVEKLEDVSELPTEQPLNGEKLEDVSELPAEQPLNGEKLEDVGENKSLNGEKFEDGGKKSLDDEKLEEKAADPSNDELADGTLVTSETNAADLKPSNMIQEGPLNSEDEETEMKEEPKDDYEDEGDGVVKEIIKYEDASEKQVPKSDLVSGQVVQAKNVRQTNTHSWETQYLDGYESGTEEEQYEFRREVENFYKENGFEFKAPKFYKEDVNILKLYREVIKLGGYEQVTSCKLWRQVGAPFKPPKTCTTVSFTFRNFYEKALIEYEKHRIRCGELPFAEDSYTAPKVEHQVGVSHSSGTGRAIRDAAARAMHVWNTPPMIDGDDGRPSFLSRSDRNPRNNGGSKRKKPSNLDHPVVQGSRMKGARLQMNFETVDVGPPADWVKVHVYKLDDCFEVYCLVPGLLRDEVHVQSDPAGRLVITGKPQQLDNLWGVTPFKKVVILSCRIDPHQISAVVTLYGQLFVRVPFEQTDM